MAIHGLLPLDYYHQAISKLSSLVSDPHFFIFSDDPEWAKDNLKLAFPTYLMDFNQAVKDYEDLRLMSLCKNFIVANSSFSWWGAWLGDDPYKRVFAPHRWFNQPEIKDFEIVPETWQRIFYD